MYYIINIIKNYGFLLFIWLILLIMDTGLLINYVLIIHNLLITPLIFFYLKIIFFNRLVLLCLCLYFFLSLYSIKIPGYKYFKFFGYDGMYLKKKYWASFKYLTSKNIEIFLIAIFFLYFLFMFFNKVYNENKLLMFIFITICGIGLILFIKRKWIEGSFSKTIKFIVLFVLLIFSLKLAAIEICSDLLYYNIYFDKIAFKIAAAKIDVYNKMPKVDLGESTDETNSDLNEKGEIAWVKRRDEDYEWVTEALWWEKIRVMYFFDLEFSSKNIINEIIDSLKGNLIIKLYNQTVTFFNIIMDLKNYLIEFLNYVTILKDIINLNNWENNIINKIENSIIIYNEENTEAKDIVNLIEENEAPTIFLNEKNDEGGIYVRDALVGDNFFEFSRKNYYKHNFLLENLYSLDLYMLNHDDFEDRDKMIWIQNIIKIRDEAKNFNWPIENDESWDDYSLYFSKYLDILKYNNLNWIFEWTLNIQKLYESTLAYNKELSKDTDDSMDYWRGELPFLLKVEKQDLLNDLNYNLCKENDYIVEISNGLFLDKNNKCDYFLNSEIQDWNDNLIDIFVRKYYGYKVSQEENDLYEAEFIGLQKPKLYNRKETELWFLNKQSRDADSNNDQTT